MRMPRDVYNVSYRSDDMATEDLRNTLEQLGLSGHEPAVYAALLERSPAGAAWIAKRCGLSRSSVYTTLGALIGKGLVGETHANDVKQFTTEGPGALVELLRHEQARAETRVERATRLAAELAKLGVTAQVPEVVHFEGAEGLRRIYLAMLRAAPPGATLRIVRDEFIWQPAWAFVFEEAWRAKVRRLKQDKRLVTRLLVNHSAIERRHAAYYRSRRDTERRYLRVAVERFGLYVCGDTAALLSLDASHLLGVRIVNAHVAANLAAVFDGLWR
jgi:DNA-binding MarR family transcriptional regulator